MDMLLFPHSKFQAIRDLRRVASSFLYLRASKSTFRIPIGRKRISDLTEEELDELGTVFGY